MRLKALYETAYKSGIAADPRGIKGIEHMLRRAGKEFEDLPERKRWEFDQECLTNPYADTRILVGTGDEEVKSILVGIDMEVGEVLLADALRSRGTGIDLLLAHHPEGRAVARLEEVMLVQADIWRIFGVPISFGDAVMSDRMAEVTRAIHPSNTQRAIDAARLMGFPFMCCHTPADNNVNRFLQARCDELSEDATVDELVDLLKEIPEYREAVLQGAGPTVFEGSGERRTGKIMVDMTGGTSGPVESIGRLAASGVGTIVGMHMNEEHRKKAKADHMNVVIAGHMSSDSLGMNLVIDEFERAGVEVIACSGFTRVSRI
jgi:putative NIF3 family GTP cyclohydrolase 1 type 2